MDYQDVVKFVVRKEGENEEEEPKPSTSYDSQMEKETESGNCRVGCREIPDDHPVYSIIDYQMEFVERPGAPAPDNDPDVMDKFKTKLLHSMISIGVKVESINSLLAAGADVNARNPFGETFLHFAVRKNRKLDVIKTLISAGGDVNTLVDQRTLLHVVCSADTAKELLSLGLSVNATDGLGKTPLHTILEDSGRGETLKLVQELLHHGAKVNEREHHGKTPLHLINSWWRVEKKLEILRELLKFGGDVNARDSSSQTPLCRLMKCAAQMNVEFKNIELVKMLLSYGSDINLRSHHGKTPLDESLVRGRMFWFKFLIKVFLMRNFQDDYENIIDLKRHRSSVLFNKFNLFVDKCAAEIQLMKSEVVNNYVSLYEFLIFCDKSENVIPLRSYNKHIEEEILTNYPIYSHLVLPRVRSCIERTNLIDNLIGLKIFICTEGREVSFVMDCLMKVTEYLSNGDFANFLTACNKRIV